MSFEFADLGTVFFLVILEGLLSADNALVLAIMCRHLPTAYKQKSALTWGLAMSFVFRCIAIIFITRLIGFWWLQAIGAAYLLYLPLKHFATFKRGPGGKGGIGKGYWATVVALGLADVAFAIDSVLAAVGVEPRPEKIWIVFLGAFAGVVLLRFAATVFIKLLDKYPLLDHLAYLLVGWVGIKLAMMGGHNFVVYFNERSATPLGWSIPEMSAAVFWTVLAVIVVGGGLIAVRRARTVEADLSANKADSPAQDDDTDTER